MMTRHATQRSIPPLAVELFERNGVICRHDGAEVLFMDKQARKRIGCDFRGARELRSVDPLLDA